MIKTGDIIFVRGDGIFSPIIRFFDKGRFSHCCVAISNTHIVEAQYFNNVKIRPFYYGDNEIEIIDLGLNEEQKRIVISIALQLTGKWYDYRQLVGYVFKRIFIKDGKNILNNPNNLICSELVSQILLETGFILPHEKVSDLTPNQLYNYLKNICDTRANCKKEDLIV